MFCVYPSLFLLRKRKEREVQKGKGESLENLESKLRGKAETLGLSLEQKTKDMKLRDKKVVSTAGWMDDDLCEIKPLYFRSVVILFSAVHLNAFSTYFKRDYARRLMYILVGNASWLPFCMHELDIKKY